MSGFGAVDKCALAQQFSGAAHRYDVWATAQAEIATRLMQRIPAQFTPSLMMDLGCGTGLLSAQMLHRYQDASLVGIDLAAGMVEHCRQHLGTNPRARFVTGDVEDAAMLVPQTSLIASSCVAQWFTVLPATVRMWARTLVSGGLMAFACLLRGSFCELESAYYEALQCSFHGLVLPSPETMPALFRASALRPIVCAEDCVIAYYGSPRQALRSFQQIGAVFHGQPGYHSLGPAALRRLIAYYDRHADLQGRVPVTHRVQYVIAERTN